jgi:C4-dicarboxylate-specific signal transduction histidine kinase/ActR/RegA family two-component response regulator
MAGRLVSPLLRYGGAAIAVALAALATELLWSAMQTSVNALFLAAVMVSAWYGGLGPGLIATLLSALTIEYFFEAPYYSITFHLRDEVRDAVFVLVALLINSLNSRRQRAEERLQASSQLLERRVAERTADVHRREQQARSLIEVGQAITSSLELQAVLELIVDRACVLVGATRFALAAVEQEEPEAVVRFIARRGLSPVFLERMRPTHWRDGTTAAAIKERRTVWSADILNDPELPLSAPTRAVVEAEGYRAVLSVPLLFNERAIGALVMYRDTVGPFSPEEIDLLQTFAAHAAIAVENARLFASQQLRAARLRALARLTHIVSSSLDTSEVLSAIARAAAELMNAPLVSIWIADEAREIVRLRALSDDAFADDHPSVRRFGEGGTGWVARHRRPLHAADVFTDDRILARDWFAAHGLSSSLSLPVLFDESLLGVLVLFGRRPFAFDADEQELLDSFVAQAAVAIRNARLYEEVRTAHESLAHSQEQLIHSEKLGAIGRLVAGIAHELNNPLAAVLGRAYLAERESDSPAVKEQIRQLRESAERAAEIVRNLLQFARHSPATVDAVDVNVLVERVLDLSGSAGITRDVTVVRSLGPEIPHTWGDFVRLQQALLNVIANACQAMGEAGGVLTVTTSTRAGVIRIEMADTGPGVAPEIRTRIFDPFFTTRPVGKGTGLGLSVAHGIVAAHDGRIWLDESESPGARFVVELPVRGAQPVTTPVVTEPATPAAGRNALVVDDDALVSQVLAALLQQLGMNVVVARSARDARERLAETTFDLITLDLVMPGESGDQFWQSLARERPQAAARAIFITGDVDDAMQTFLDSTGRPVLAKPYTFEALRDLVTRELAAEGAARPDAPAA